MGPSSRRMHIFASVDQIRRHWLSWLFLLNILYGGYHLFSSGVPFWCGVLLLVATVGMGFGYSVPGAAVATAVWSVFLFVAVAAFTPGDTLPVGDLVLSLGSAGWHALVIYEVGTGLDELRERQQRSSGER